MKSIKSMVLVAAIAAMSLTVAASVPVAPQSGFQGTHPIQGPGGGGHFQGTHPVTGGGNGGPGGGHFQGTHPVTGGGNGGPHA